MSVQQPDRAWEHLYPEFAAKLRRVLYRIGQRTDAEWGILEGYRSKERQEWLYAQGRTRPGPVVTWMRTPKNHGIGLAADVHPFRGGRAMPYSEIPRHWYTWLREEYQREGLGNGAWGKGDLAHIEWTNPVIRARAASWVKAGFRGGISAPPSSTPPPPDLGDRVLVGDRSWPAYRDETGAAMIPIRPVCGALGWRLDVTATTAHVELPSGIGVVLRLVIRDGVGYVPAAGLRRIGVEVTWHPDTRTVRIG